jgi:anti-anti-sigma factor
VSSAFPPERPTFVWEQERFRWSQWCAGPDVYARVEGELDLSTAGPLGRLLRELTARAGGAGAIRLDLSDLTFCDANSAGLFQLAGMRARLHGRRLCVSGLRGLPARVFAILGVETSLWRPTQDAPDGGDRGARPPATADGAGHAAAGADPSC